MNDERDQVEQADDDELARLVEALEAAGLAQIYERSDGTSAVRLTERGRALLQDLPAELAEQ